MSTPVYSDDLDRRLSAVNARLAAIEAHLVVLSRAVGVPYTPPATDVIPPEVVALAQAGKKLDAIKAYRAATGAGMDEAQRAVDQL